MSLHRAAHIAKSSLYPARASKVAPSSVSQLVTCYTCIVSASSPSPPCKTEAGAARRGPSTPGRSSLERTASEATTAPLRKHARFATPRRTTCSLHAMVAGVRRAPCLAVPKLTPPAAAGCY